MDPNFQRIVFLLNPWLINPDCFKDEVGRKIPGQFVDRSILKFASERWGDCTKVHLVIGARQTGKSSAVWKYLLASSGRVLFLNCEEQLIQEMCLSPAVFQDEIKELLGQVDIIFFEEAQHLKDAGLFLKGLIDQKNNRPILVTGSSSYHLHAKTRESLAGRATRTRVTPFTLEELLPNEGLQSMASWRALACDVIANQLRYGSYPAVWLAKKKEDLLFDLIEAFVIRDASDLFRIRHVGSFRQLLKLISWQTGKLVNYSEWGGLAGIDYHTTKNYIDVLQESHIIEVVQPFAGGKRAELTSSPVIYFMDVGIRNALANQFTALDERADRGELFQSWVFSELNKLLPTDVSIRFWRSKSGSESDFVLLKGGEIAGIEVKCARLKEGKISRSSRSFIEAYAPSKFFVINRGFEGESYVNKTHVVHIRPESIFRIVRDF